MNIESQNQVHSEYENLTKYLVENHISISTMESCTSGLIASLITDTDGSSAVIKGAFVTYSNEGKILQGVPSQTIETFGVYSLETAAEMAKACAKAYQAQIGIGVTGTLGKADPNNKDSVPGEVYLAINYSGNVTTKLIQVAAETRFEAKLQVADQVFYMLHEILQLK